MKPAQKRGPKIVGYGNGPHMYAGEAVGVNFDGATITVVFGNLEVRLPEKDATPTDPPVISICGKITMSPAAAVATVGMLTNVLNAITGQQPKAPHGAVMN